MLTGELGAAAAGLLAEESSEPAAAVDAGTLDGLLGRQREPTPRLGVGATLAAAGAHAMIDLSDGLGGDAGHMAEAGGVRLLIDGDLVPRAEGVEAVALAAGRDPAEVALTGGEDYELLAAMPPGVDHVGALRCGRRGTDAHRRGGGGLRRRDQAAARGSGSSACGIRPIGRRPTRPHR